MPRPCKCRRIHGKTPACGFKPTGIPGHELETVELGLDELEAIRLADFEGLYHDAAAQRMGISRPTFGRVIERARHKVACALIHSKMLTFKGGPVITSTARTFECADCGGSFDVPQGEERPSVCPACEGHNFHRADGGCHRGKARCRKHRQQPATATQRSQDQEENTTP
jgi:predicted DNA-binding protein (UPF0251 family)